MKNPPPRTPSNNNGTPPQTGSGRTYHRWTPEEDEALLTVCDQLRPQLESIGTPGGMTRELFWSSIPGRINLFVTPTACQMRYRTLTSDSAWAKRRRGDDTDAAVAADTTVDLLAAAEAEGIASIRQELSELRGVMVQLLEVWTGGTKEKS